MGAPTRQVQAFNVILDSHHPTEIFSDILARGHTAGRLYALCADQVLRHPDLKRIAADLRLSDGEVRTFSGCIMDRQSVRKVVDQIVDDKLGRTFRRAKKRTDEYFAQTPTDRPSE